MGGFYSVSPESPDGTYRKYYPSGDFRAMYEALA